jgi:hypothetical protein
MVLLNTQLIKILPRFIPEARDLSNDVMEDGAFYSTFLNLFITFLQSTQESN